MPLNVVGIFSGLGTFVHKEDDMVSKHRAWKQFIQLM